ncbi:nuclear transport factor 2 family protein [Luteimonas sp BLCC-B24]|uniref:nuclear transport factor 2 family protein n=1 Tax=Luteimonas sp. BLCC-B24 TaxID=3025317 RepID=UPI00234D453F|nr:nuclear transport factor 2 family protein [Luteimonas sp. BLCC-B24]MDC7808337.1 nuclear transport factor 2 family protein [Luteimonas sp. BLCC-B24]
MHTLDLPEPIAAYFEADRQDGAAVARCFNDDGVVRDEGRTHSGPAQIADWKAAMDTKYDYVARPLALAQNGGAYVVTTHVSGAFPGSPVNLRYTFTLARGRIAALEIAP